jgi:hypothetical protein
MHKDLFQMSQMSDIYYTMSLWSILSPDMREDKAVDPTTRHKAKKRSTVSIRKRTGKRAGLI